MPEVILTEEELARQLRVHPETLARQRRAVKAEEPQPPIVRVGRFVRWLGTEGDPTKPYREWSEAWHRSKETATPGASDGALSAERPAAAAASRPAAKPTTSATRSRLAGAGGRTGSLGLSGFVRNM